MDLYVVTGTSRGLGHALAEQLRTTPQVRLVTVGRRGATVVADLATAEGAQAASEAIAREAAHGPYGKAVLINNAGVVDPVGPLDEVDAEALARNLHVNLVAPMLLMRGFLRATAAVPLRRIVNISSGAGRRPVVGWSAYCAAKAGLDMASRVVAVEAEWRGTPLEIVSLAPGVIDTGMQAVVRGATEAAFPDVARFKALKAEGHLRRPEDVASEILRLEAAGKLAGEPLRDLREMG